MNCKPSYLVQMETSKTIILNWSGFAFFSAWKKLQIVATLPAEKRFQLHNLKREGQSGDFVNAQSHWWCNLWIPFVLWPLENWSAKHCKDDQRPLPPINLYVQGDQRRSTCLTQNFRDEPDDNHVRFGRRGQIKSLLPQEALTQDAQFCSDLDLQK